MIQTPPLSARIAFISPTGWGNLGDAAIIDSLIHGIRRRIPDAAIVGFTQNPRDTADRHGIPAFTLSGLDVPRYKIWDGPAPAAGGAEPTSPAWPSLARRAIASVPGARRAYHLAREVAAERRHRRLSAERIRGFDFVVVAGGGQLDDFWGGPFGHPYTLWRWAGLSRGAGARYVILSVGTGTLSPLSARFVRRALALADYRSYRDGRSRELLGDPALTRDDPVVPDLAYALPLSPPAGFPLPPRPAIGLGPLAYVDPSLGASRERARYRRHIQAFTGLAVRLARAGHDVLVFTSEASDRKPVAEVRAGAEAELTPEERARIRAPEIDGVAGLMRALADCEVVVASRLHGVLLSHVAGRPVLAVSYERKVRTLMDGMGHGRYCFEFDDFGAEAAWERFGELHARRAELAGDVRRTVADYRRSVEEQYDHVFGPTR